MFFGSMMLFSVVILSKSNMHFVSANLGINTGWGLLHSWVQLAAQVISLAFLLKAFILRPQPVHCWLMFYLVSCFPTARKVRTFVYGGQTT